MRKPGLLWLAGVLVLSGCASQSYADMSGYSLARQTSFYEAETADFLKAMEDRETMTVFFGFESCPFCQTAVPLLAKAAADTGGKVFYINTRQDPEWTSNQDLPGYDLVVQQLSEYLLTDENGEAQLYVPAVFFIRDGAVISAVNGTGTDEAELTDSEELKLYETYVNGFLAEKQSD